MNSNSRESSETAIETMRLVISEVSKKIDELNRDSNSQIAETIISVISEKILPNIQNTMTNKNPVFREEVDRRSSGLSRTTEEKRARNA